MSKISVGDYVRLKDGHEREYSRGYGYRDEEDEMVKLYKDQGSLRDTSDIGVVVSKGSGDAIVEGFTRLTQTEHPMRISYSYKESALVKVEEAVKNQISWFFRCGSSAASGGGAAVATANAVDIADHSFFGFGTSERDDLLHMMFLCLCLGKLNSSSNKPDALFADGKMTFKQFIHGLSLVGNPCNAPALKAAMDAFETKIRVNYRVAPGADYRQVEGAAAGAYRRFWDNMYWVLSSFPALKCPERINDDFNKKDMLFADCLKIGFDLLPADHPHKAPFLAFMMDVKAKEFREQAKRHLESASTRQNMITKFREEGYEHYVRAFGRSNGTIAYHEWSNVWLLGNVGPAPQFSGWNPSFNSPCLDKVVKDYVLANIDPALLQEEDECDEGY